MNPLPSTDFAHTERSAPSKSEGRVAPGRGTIYTETVIHSAPAAFVADAPYQIAIVELESGERVTARIAGDRVAIGDAVEFLEHRNEIPFFRKT